MLLSYFCHVFFNIVQREMLKKKREVKQQILIELYLLICNFLHCGTDKGLLVEKFPKSRYSNVCKL